MQLGNAINSPVRGKLRLFTGALLSLWLYAPMAAPADDPAAPFLGTWSGVFTTQDHEYWLVEDFVCFPGCTKATRDYMTALLADRANDASPFGALLGRSIVFAEQQIAAILTPLGKQIQAANSPATDPKLHCQPYGFVRQLTNPLPLTIQRDGEHLLVRYEEWSLLRTIYMDGRAHPEHRTPTLLGHSIGRVENGMLIIETARVTPDWISDYTHAGHSGELTAVERYTIRENPRRLELELTIEDPVTLTQPYQIIKTWLYTPEVTLVQDQCSELPGKF